MNSNQVEGRADAAKDEVKQSSGKGTGEKRAQSSGNHDKRGDKSETVLANINGEAKKPAN